MSLNLYESKENIGGVKCTDQGFAERVNRYLDDPLNSPEADKVEDHLLDCRACREFVDTILSVLGEAARTNARGGNAQSRKDMRVTRIATFRK